MKIRTVSLQLLMEDCFEPALIESYCSLCENYNQHFSCPSHEFSLISYLSNFKYALIISHKLQAKLDEYYFWRELIDPLLLQYESRFHGTSLMPGSCQNCDYCFDRGALECSSPELLRYSFESLGFDVKEILNIYFKEQLIFQPTSLHLIYGMLLKEKPDPLTLNDFQGDLYELSN